MSEQPFQDEVEMTAEECINQGIQLFEDSKRKEALNYFEKAISLDSQSAIAYSHKGLILLSIGDRQEGLDCLNKGLLLDPYHPNALVDKGILLMDNADDTTELFEQAISQNPSNAGGYVYQALNLFALGRNEEALEYIDKALEIKPNDPIFCAKKSEILNYLKRLDEALEWAKKAISLDPECSDGYLAKSYVHYDKREKAALRTSLDKAIALNPYNARAYSLKGTYLCNQGQVDAGLESMDKAISLTPKDFRAYRTKGLRLITLERYAEALEVFETAISVRSDQAYLWCKKGEILNKLNRMDEAIESFRKANDLILNHPTSTAMIEPQYIDEIKGTITSALEVYDVSKEVENEMNKLDQKDNLPKEFIQRMKVLNDKKNLATKILLSGYGEKDQMKEERDKYKQELKTLKDEFTQQLESIRKKVDAVEERVSNAELQLEEIRLDLSTKMNDYRKKLNMDLPQFGLDPDQVWTVIQYYNAFVETFSSIYVVSQVVESGQVALCAGGNLLANALSMVASFTPFVGGLLSKGIKSIGVFLETREMKQTSRKLMSLATDTADLSQMTGGVVYDMMMQNKDKRDQIVNITNGDLKDEPQKLLDKVIFFCQMVAEEKDARLYGELYKSPAAKLGHMDANKLIEFWIKDPTSPNRLRDLSGLNETFRNELSPKHDKNELLSEAYAESPQPQKPESHSRPDLSDKKAMRILCCKQCKCHYCWCCNGCRMF